MDAIFARLRTYIDNQKSIHDGEFLKLLTELYIVASRYSLELIHIHVSRDVRLTTSYAYTPNLTLDGVLFITIKAPNGLFRFDTHNTDAPINFFYYSSCTKLERQAIIQIPRFVEENERLRKEIQ